MEGRDDNSVSLAVLKRLKLLYDVWLLWLATSSLAHRSITNNPWHPLQTIAMGRRELLRNKSLSTAPVHTAWIIGNDAGWALASPLRGFLGL